MNAVEICLAAMRETVARLDELLVPWGFAFDLAENGDAFPGAFASGFYRRGPTRLGLVYRRTLGLGVVLYERETVTQNGCLREHEVFGMDHLAYMRRARPRRRLQTCCGRNLFPCPERRRSCSRFA